MLLLLLLLLQITHVTLLRQPDDPNKLRGYAFVHFTERPMALRVLTDAEAGKEFELDGKQLAINMARPQVRGIAVRLEGAVPVQPAPHDA